MIFAILKYKVKKITLLLFVAIILVACTSSNPTAPHPDKKPLYFRITWTEYSGRGTAINEIVKAFNESNNQSYEVIMIGGDEDMTHISDLLNDTENPMIYALPYRLVKYYGEQGDLMDLSSDFISESAHFYPEIWKLGITDHKIYGIPWVGHSICLIYNLDLLTQACVDPTDIDNLNSFVDALDKIQSQTDSNGVGLVGANHNDVSWMINQFIYAYGAQLVDSTGQKVLINDPLAKETILFYKETLGLYAQPSWRDDTGIEVMNYFREGQIAFEFQGIWGVTDIDKNKNPFEIGIIPLDAIGLKPEIGPIMLTASKNMPDEMRAVTNDFIKFMISSEAQTMIFK